MGRKLDLSKLTDEEAKHVWEVVQRDFDLRKKEEERLEELKGKIRKESTKKELLSGPAHLNETHCGRCLQPYRFLVSSKRQCLDCHVYTCQKCGSYNRRAQDWVCDACRLARVVKTGSLDWYYEHVRARFKRFGSDKVMRSLHGRLQLEHSNSPASGLHNRSHSLPDVNSGAQLSPVGGSGESEQTSEDEALDGAEAQHLSREKRLLSVHPFDFEVDSDCSAQSCPQSLQLCPAPTTLDGFQDVGFHSCDQTLSDAPSADDDHEEAASQKDALITDASLAPEAEDLLEEQGCNSPKVSVPSDPSLERKPSPEGEAMGSDQPQVQYFADMDTSDKDLEEAHQMAAPPAHYSKRRSWTSSPESTAPSETQSLGPEPRKDADIEEEALKRKLGELTSKVSDKGGSSEEEEEGQSGLSPGGSSVPDSRPIEAQQAGQTHGGENRLLDLEEQVPRTRSPESALSELEDRVTLTAAEVQHAKREVSDIKSRIAALSAAGLLVKTWEKPRNKSNLQILPLQPPKSSLGVEEPELSGANKVMARPNVQRRIFNNSLQLQDRVDGPFSRIPVYRGSLTQRNPNGKNRRVNHIFAKPVMIHQP
ncbi:melanophilin isoform X2 [Vombatus ursinus]|uniref:RabBD domain-containing protein n=1 Tax=Vombatus ursinus TaxID=29139 RepID=A0A4X2M6Q2_VOMUR|nr:melanophilin isoform X2 [Vombatus ursinus]